MNTIIKGFLMFSLGIFARVEAQVIQDPVRAGAEPGRTCLVWKVDINNDGILDMLVGDKPTAKEISDRRHLRGPALPEDSYTFAVYLGVRNGLGYIDAGGIDAEMSHCYVGYIKQLKKFGIVTLDARIIDDPDEPQAKHGVLKKQICCFTLEAGQMKKTDFTPLLDDWERSPIYKMYLSESKRTTIQLREITP